MENSVTFLAFIPLLPLLGALVIGLVYLFSCRAGKLPEGVYALLGMIAPFFAVVLAIRSAVMLSAMPAESKFLTQKVFTWFQVGSLHVDMGFLADPLSVLMLLFITIVGALIHVYSIGYMRGDEHFGKFFCYLNLFLGAMLLLVLGDGPVVMFVGWEGVGLCSYLLISFYSTEKNNVLAGNKAFIVNRVGDIGFVLGVSLLFWAAGANGFDYAALKQGVIGISPGVGLAVCLLLFFGATGKSAQIPLYVWLPDAMAGPTPVSALIHAATMVTAGVYMVARFSFLYVQFPAAGTIIAWIGILTALLAAIFAMFQRDIKKILAYSTISQLGYMFAGVGVAAYSSGIFHVFTHSFFKALLFLCAGSVICALHHEQDIWKMGGLKAKMPVTYWTMLIGALALSGCPFFSGFFSKDEILYSALVSGHVGIWLVGVCVAAMTAFYTFRMIFVVFHGRPRDKKLFEHAKESPLVMTVPLLLLAIGAFGSGYFNVPSVLFGEQALGHYLLPSLAEHAHEGHAVLESLAMLVSICAFVLGIVMAKRRFYRNAVEPRFTGFARAAENLFYVDQAYDSIFVRSFVGLGQFFSRFFEKWVADGVLRLAGFLYMIVGDLFSVVQTGHVRVYALYIIVGLSLMSLLLSYSL